MNIILNESERKPLATLLGEYKNTKPLYLRAPSYGYQIGDLLLTREGNIEGPDTMSQAEFDKLLQMATARKKQIFTRLRNQKLKPLLQKKPDLPLPFHLRMSMLKTSPTFWMPRAFSSSMPCTSMIFASN